MATITIQQNVGGYTGTTDTYIRGSKPTTAYNTATIVYSDGSDSAGAEIQGLLSFANLFGNGPGQIPLGSTITSATLTLSLSDGTNSPLSFYRMASDWTTSSSLTWNGFGNGIQTDGIEALSSADVSLSSLGTGIQSINVMSSIQAWANGGANYGWLLKSGGSDGFAFSSSEGGAAPILTITYEPPVTTTPGMNVTESGGSTTVVEGGANDTLVIALKTAPTADVTVTIWTAGPGDVGLTPTVLTFTAANWSTAQAFTLSAIDDLLVEGSESFAGTVTTASTDANYNGLTFNFNVGVTDNDNPPPPPGIDVVQSGGSTTVVEGGPNDTLVIALKSAPTADVTVTIWTAGPGDVGLTPTVLTFTVANWSVTQTVTLSAINDTLIEGNESFAGTVTTSSADSNYNGLTSNFTVGVTDNDQLPTVLSPFVVAVRNSTLYTAGDPGTVKGSGDPSGIAYVPGLDRLFIVDSEHDESPYHSTKNLFVTTRDGTFIESFSLQGFTKEPTGIAYNPFNGFLYISDDDNDRIYIVDPNNPTVAMSSINVLPMGSTDCEDPEIDPFNGHIYFLDGLTRSFFELTETGTFVSSHTLPIAIRDPEAMAYDPLRDVFYFAGGATRGTIFQTDHNGNILSSFSLLNTFLNNGSRPKIKGLELALSSDPNDGDRMSLYAVDYGTDQKLDGRWFEIDLYHDWPIV